MADPWGIEHAFINSRGENQQVSEETIEGLRQALGEPSDERGPLVLLTEDDHDLGEGEILLESGSTVSAQEVDVLPAGYHTLVDPGGERDLIVSPGRCHLPEDLHGWGWASQLYGTRSRRSWGIGDLTDLRRLAVWSRAKGATFVMISPIVAAAPTAHQEPNPYYPASRRFRNPLYLAIEDIPGAEHMGGAIAEAARAGHALNEDEVVDHDAVWRVKLCALEAIWDSTAPPDKFERWIEAQPKSLSLFGLWCVIAEQHGSDWRQWPTNLQRPESADTAAIRSTSDDRIRFYMWLQWCLAGQLAEAGKEIAVVQDLPIGFDPGGFDAWEWQDLLARGASVGAPPDPFNQTGQDWGAPPFVPWRLRGEGYRPFLETVRANLAARGGLRIDHVMGLWRLWCIPPGAGPAEGAYVRFPARDLLAILALESSRARTFVVGEDLGTVEAGVRETLLDHDMLSYRLLWFEQKSPEDWPVNAMGAVTTHDLPTVAGLWDGSDLGDQRELGLTVDDDRNAAIRARLIEVTELDGPEEAHEAVLEAHRALSRAPSRLLCVTLEDALCARERPNMPGASERSLNWRTALSLPLEDIQSRPLVDRIARAMNERQRGREFDD